MEEEVQGGKTPILFIGKDKRLQILTKQMNGWCATQYILLIADSSSLTSHHFH